MSFFKLLPNDEIMQRPYGERGTLHYRDAHHIVIRWPGHKVWGGIGSPPVYIPAQFEVFRIKRISEDDKGTLIETENPHVIKFDVRKDKA